MRPFVEARQQGDDRHVGDERERFLLDPQKTQEGDRRSDQAEHALADCQKAHARFVPDDYGYRGFVSIN